jgi:heavy metal translocating P-type ATPase
MSATILRQSGSFRTSLLERAEKLILALRLTLAMLAAGLLLLSLLWAWAFPQESALANLVAGGAAILVSLPVLAAAWHSLRHPSLHGVTDRLIALALVGAWAAGDLMTAAVLPIVMILGHVLEERSLLGSREAIRALSRLAEVSARRLRPGGAVDIVPTAALRPGDLIELRAGDRVPADGTVREGEASLDMASLTGESVPVDVAVGARVMAGSIDTDGRLVVEVQSVGQDTTLGKIIALMREAESAKPPVTRLLERYAGQYMLLVLMVAGGTWFASGDMAATLAVLVSACPCALVLAAPATAIAGIAVAGRHGILIKGTAFLENLADVTSVIFDKTGTLTTGELTLTDVLPEPGADAAHVTLLAGSLGSASSHPVSRAARRALVGRVPLAVETVREAGGFGVVGSVAGETAAYGRPDLFANLGIAASPPPVHDGPIAGVSLGGSFLGWLLFADQPRREAVAALAGLRGLGLERQMLLTGDRASVAARIASVMGITDVHAEALPHAKMRQVLAEVRAGYRPLVVGDGINDSLALKAGAVGVAMGAQGTDVAMASADLVLMSSDLRRLATAIRLSRRCRRTIQVNVGLGLGWTLVLMGLAAAGVLGAGGAVIAALMHNLSTFLGVANAGRLLLFDETGEGDAASPPQGGGRA